MSPGKDFSDISHVFAMHTECECLLDPRYQLSEESYDQRIERTPAFKQLLN